MDIITIKQIIDSIDLNKFFIQAYNSSDKLEFSFPLSMGKGRIAKIGKLLLVNRILLKSGEKTLDDQHYVDKVHNVIWKLSGLSAKVVLDTISEEENKLLDQLELSFKKKSSKTEVPDQEIDEDLD